MPLPTAAGAATGTAASLLMLALDALALQNT
jgi:hypothetical protein